MLDTKSNLIQLFFHTNFQFHVTISRPLPLLFPCLECSPLSSTPLRNSGATGSALHSCPFPRSTVVLSGIDQLPALPSAGALDNKGSKSLLFQQSRSTNNSKNIQIFWPVVTFWARFFSSTVGLGLCCGWMAKMDQRPSYSFTFGHQGA